MSGNHLLQPINTAYAGRHFRSRLEARWGVFFDVLGLSWEYEPEGFTLADGTRYLPDFRVWTPQGNPIWYEVKPNSVSHDAKLTAFERALEEAHYLNDTPSDHYAPAWRTALLSGDPIDVLGEKAHICPRCGFIDTYVQAGLTSGSWECDTYCFPCDIETPSQGDPEAGMLGMTVQPWKGHLEIERLADYMTFMSRIFEAASIARRARFEHGAQLPMPDYADVIRLVTKHVEGMR